MYQAATIILRRFYSSVKSTKNVVQHLEDRSLIKVTGTEAAEFLQGLITNDINHLSKGPGAMFTMFLNVKGRVLYDALIYRNEEDNTYFIECDKDAITPLQKHLKIYKLKRKVQMDNYDSHKVFAFYNSNVILNQGVANDCDILDGDHLKDSLPQNSTEYKTHNDLSIFKDPRVPSLGFRIITKENISKTQIKLNDLVECNISTKENNYKTLRYSLGVGEGINDLPTANCTPLENNCDYLHGVSFHKGCYLGQELTARSYHTGVIRKRLLPIFFTNLPKTLPENNTIIHEDVNLGKLRGIENNCGLALLRISQALEFGTIKIRDGVAKVVKPSWWPIELPKEKISVQKS